MKSQLKSLFMLLLGTICINLLLFPLFYFIMYPITTVPYPGPANVEFHLNIPSRLFIVYDALRVILCTLLGWYIGGERQWRLKKTIKKAVARCYRRFGVPIVAFFILWLGETLTHTIGPNLRNLFSSWEVQALDTGNLFDLCLIDNLLNPYVWFAYFMMFTAFCFRRANIIPTSQASLKKTQNQASLPLQ